MDRKEFLGTASALVAGSSLPLSTFGNRELPQLSFIPPYLSKGDIIGITAPAGYITQEEIMPAIKVMESWGFRIKLGDTIGRRNFTFGGTDHERAADFQQMLNDQRIKAIMCARGGYGAVRIVDKLKWEQLKQKPKWIIGFSDITIFHSHINRNYGIASIHSKMCNSFPDEWEKAEPIQIETIESIRQALTGQRMRYTTIPNPSNRYGTAEGVLVGGNLKLLETMSGTSSDLNTAGKILFLEDTGEYMYNIDRMFWHLQRTGKLAKLKGLIIGGFKVKVDEGDDEFGKTVQDIVMEKVYGFSYPVCFDFPVGHQRNNYALKCGVRHRLNVNAETCTLDEIK